jgi:protoporphyrinogen oxidase
MACSHTYTCLLPLPCLPPAPPGFGAAKHLAEAGYAVTLLEASKNPGGLSGGFRTASGQVVEAGMKG